MGSTRRDDSGFHWSEAHAAEMKSTIHSKPRVRLGEQRAAVANGSRDIPLGQPSPSASSR